MLGVQVRRAAVVWGLLLKVTKPNSLPKAWAGSAQHANSKAGALHRGRLSWVGMKLHNPLGLLLNARVWAQPLTCKVFQLMLMLSWEHGEGSCWAALCSDILKSLTDPTKWRLTSPDPDLHRSSRSKVHPTQQPVCSSDQQTMPGGRCPMETGPGHGTAL